jgi:D-arabinose 5-phosphate isomerase GutQ
LVFREMKRKKERGVSNEEFMDKSKEFFKDADSIIVVGMDKDGFINTFYTQLSSTQVIGMVEIAKQQLIQETEV